MPVASVNAGPNLRYFGRGRGVTWLNVVNDQVLGIGAVIVPGTVRDSLYILDALFDIDAGLRPEQVITDTASYSNQVFGLFNLLGYQFSPRLADLPDQRWWRIDPDGDYGALNSVSRHRVNLGLIRDNWADLLRLAGSLLAHTVKVSEVMRLTQGAGRPTTLGRALAEYGRVSKTCTCWPGSTTLITGAPWAPGSTSAKAVTRSPARRSLANEASSASVTARARKTSCPRSASWSTWSRFGTPAIWTPLYASSGLVAKQCATRTWPGYRLSGTTTPTSMAATLSLRRPQPSDPCGTQKLLTRRSEARSGASRSDAPTARPDTANFRTVPRQRPGGAGVGHPVAQCCRHSWRQQRRAAGTKRRCRRPRALR